MKEHIAMIGAGNMARALIAGLLASGRDPGCITATDPDPAARRAATQDFGIAATADNAAAVATADTIVLAVKPQVIEDVLASIAASVAPETLIVSVAAGIPIARIERALGRPQPVVRVMPNTPALLGVGATGMHASAACSADQTRRTRQLFEAVGQVFEVEDEALMDVVTAISGSGPAYFFAFAEALALAGAAAGLDPATARGLAVQTAAGAGRMLADPDTDPADLRRRVTSPGGTTAAALASFEADGLADMVGRAVAAAVDRGRELGAS
ncbi:MAG: pyrroline-5-carboxylate reductase [Gammaproteobacteria bacterium HGW-Gammaproteobacteria-8]|nr:MAG: pyrroline-5-carboxylate reductase [Gammaproteobacteria bacterium HGW-Gammaproteobacteria-8]